jgi:hypothetical protein
MSGLTILLFVLMLLTLVVLFIGLGAMLKGGEFNKKHGNKLMVARVGLQAAAIATLGLLFLLSKK